MWHSVHIKVSTKILTQRVTTEKENVESIDNFFKPKKSYTNIFLAHFGLIAKKLAEFQKWISWSAMS